MGHFVATVSEVIEENGVTRELVRFQVTVDTIDLGKVFAAINAKKRVRKAKSEKTNEGMQS